MRLLPSEGETAGERRPRQSRAADRLPGQESGAAPPIHRHRASLMIVVMVMMSAAAQQPRTRNVHRQPEAGNRNRFSEMNRYGLNQPRNRLVADQQGNHRQNNRTREPGQVAQFSGAKSEPLVHRVLSGITVGERRKQQRAGVCAHVQPIGDERNGAKQQAADDLGDHHQSAQNNDCPGPTLTALVIGTEKDVAVPLGSVVETGFAHRGRLI